MKVLNKLLTITSIILGLEGFCLFEALTTVEIVTAKQQAEFLALAIPASALMEIPIKKRSH